MISQQLMVGYIVVAILGSLIWAHVATRRCKMKATIRRPSAQERMAHKAEGGTSRLEYCINFNGYRFIVESFHLSDGVKGWIVYPPEGFAFLDEDIETPGYSAKTLREALHIVESYDIHPLDINGEGE